MDARRKSFWTRRGLIVGALGAFAGAGRHAFAEGEALSFLVIGDWGDPAGGVQRRVADAMARIAAEIDSDFVISTGDNFYAHGVRSVSDRHWRERYEEVYSATSLQIPWYAVLGNHDHEGSVEAEIAYTGSSGRWRMPARYWRQDFSHAGAGAVTIFFLDTTPMARGAPEQAQLAWLERELQACRSAWKFVVGHHPIVSSGGHGGSRQLAARLGPLLERHGVRAYFNGHDHDLEHLRVNGVDYICSGAGAGARAVKATPQSLFSLPQPGFAACRLTGEVLRLRFHDSEGAMAYEAVIAREAPLGLLH